MVSYFAGARAAAGLAEEKVDLDGADGAVGLPRISTLAEVLADRHGPGLARVLATCSFLLDEVAGSRDRPVHDGARVDVLPPFSGG